ncbi:MAG: universal stress protein [Solirubrobacteraceae bacterium]|jgi:nucleotide-binding universal stress UspA family protein
MSPSKAAQPPKGEAAPRQVAPEEAAAKQDALFADVLCAVDEGPESLAAVEQAAGLAGPNGHVTLLAVTSFRFEGAHRGPAIGPMRAKGILDRAMQLMDAAQVPYSVEVDPAGPPSRVILDWANERDLLAIGAPATSWLEGMFTGGVAASAESSFTTPLLVGRSRPKDQPSDRRILIASDGLPGSEQLVEWAGRLAQVQGAEAILLHAIGLESSARRQRFGEQAERLEAAFDGKTDVRIQSGSARTVIVETARAVGASLIVMSSRRLKGVRAIGSVSRRVVHEGHCSVLLLPPERLLRRTV